MAGFLVLLAVADVAVALVVVVDVAVADVAVVTRALNEPESTAMAGWKAFSFDVTRREHTNNDGPRRGMGWDSN